MGREPRCKKVRETVCQVAQTADRQQHAHRSGKEGRPENQVSGREEIENSSILISGHALQPFAEIFLTGKRSRL